MAIKIVMRKKANSSQLGGYLRAVVLAGTTLQAIPGASIFEDTKKAIKRHLEGDGFIVIAVRATLTGWVNQTYDLEIECNAYTEYSAEQIRQRAIQVIEGITVSSVTGTEQRFTNTSLRVVSDAYVPPQDGQQQQQQQQLPNNTNYPTNYPNAPQNPGGGGGLLDGIGTGTILGMSAGTLLILGIAFVALKK